MKVRNLLPMVLLAVPLAGLAQGEYSRARIAGEPPAMAADDELACADRQDSLFDRKAFLDREKSHIDLDGDAIAAEGARLADELRNLDARDTAAVAAYNSRSNDQNRRVALHNRRVADLNSASARFNGDSVDITAWCNGRSSRIR